MDIFLQNIVTFPVVIFTVLLGIVLIYWILAFIGAADVEMFDIDVDADIDLDLDIDAGADIDANGLNGLAGLLMNWGLSGIPVTVVISLLVTLSWAISYLIVSLVFPLIPFEWLKVLVGIVLLIISFALSIPITAILIRPLKKFFTSHDAVKKSSLIGLECVIKTGQVTLDFGQAELEDGEAGMILDVRANDAYGIKKGDVVLLVEYNEDDESYLVEKVK
jgi:hypothetical protein